MQIGFNAPTSGPLIEPDSFVSIITEGEALGFDYVTISDHIMVPKNLDSKYPYTDTGEFPAGTQAANALIDIGQRAQNQNGSVFSRLAQRLDDRQPVNVSREHAIHDDDIVRFAGRKEHAVTAVGRVVGGVTRLLQPLDDELRHALVILDQQYLHEAPCVSPAAPSACGTAAGTAVP